MNNNHCCPEAIAKIRGGGEASKLQGIVEFYEFSSFVFVKVNIKALPHSDSGFFGFHIHEGNSCGGTDFSDTKSHYNPENKPHPSHAGDLPPLLFCNGGACMSFTTDRFRVKDIIGKTIVIHSSPDDFTTQPSGNAGTKIACGVIKRV